MNKRFIFICCALAIIVIGLVVFIITSLNTNNDSKNSIPSISTAFIDRCSIVTAQMLEQFLSMDVVKKSSNATSCTYESEVNSTISIQVSAYYGDPQLYYLPESYKDRIELENIGDKSFYTKPIDGKSVAQLVKDTKILTISISSYTNYSGDNIKDLLSAAVSNF